MRPCIDHSDNHWETKEHFISLYFTVYPLNTNKLVYLFLMCIFWALRHCMLKEIREDYTQGYTQTKLNITVKKSLKLQSSLCSFADLLPFFLNKEIKFSLFFLNFLSFTRCYEVWYCAKTARRLPNEASWNSGPPSLPGHNWCALSQNYKTLKTELYLRKLCTSFGQV